MLFNSYIFILLFLPIAIMGYFLLNHFHKYQLAKVFLLGMSLWFYSYFNVKYLPVILLSIGLNYLACSERGRGRRCAGWFFYRPYWSILARCFTSSILIFSWRI